MLVVLLVAFVILSILMLLRRTFNPARAVREMITRIVEEKPLEMANRLGVDVDVLSLARAMRSEEGKSSEAARIAVGNAVKNHARRLGISITTLVTRTGHDKAGKKLHPEADGLYSGQELAKYCTTFEAPNSRDLELSKEILAGTLPDNTGGAEYFDNPESQAALHAKKPEIYKTPEEVAAKRQAAGLEAVAIEGTATRFWRKA